MPYPGKDIHPVPRTHDPLAADLTPADDRILLNHWLPPQEGIVLRIRVGRTLNGILFYVLLFTTNQWLRLVPGHVGGLPERGPDAIRGARRLLRSLQFDV